MIYQVESLDPFETVLTMRRQRMKILIEQVDETERPVIMQVAPWRDVILSDSQSRFRELFLQ